MNVIEVQGLGKAYRRYASGYQRLLSWFGAKVQPVAEDWVLRDIDFNLAQGETLGIIGRNGAGKSTLLKLIVGTQRPSTGQVRLQGSISAILELGMGFNPERSGLDNARHALGLMGHDSAASACLLPAIEAFAEIGEHFTQPMRTYSSGMQMRVAFAVASAQAPDLLVVDEALAVGDAYFQYKCFQRMRQLREGGTAILFVSHDSGSVLSLCDRALLLDAGRLISQGDPRSVLDHYNSLLAGQETQRADHQASQGVSRYGNGRARLDSVTIGTEAGPQDTFLVNQPCCIRVNVQAHECLPELTIGFSIRDRFGQVIHGTNTHHLRFPLRELPAGTQHRVQFNIARLALGPGDYHISVALHTGVEHSTENFDWWDAAATFTVIALSEHTFGGIVALDVEAQRLVP
ncbi:MAG: ABC transporter ATP-binding protein [Lamprobacter sp.]|uniref:ABC transporter ATP-binding protein n=1 Tax=Lamprobacter sp. TaxID=3100796 RepID=UPI002B25AAEA|nr:ABC transporter ATP-binding protein [Lamprobacter sp.]MEA3638315.1 ABC transporter ATP-binding protein [Lamprobacter sp.]